MQVKLTDFGIARLTYGTALTRSTGLIGTPENMAPETAQYGTATLAADLYSAGIVLYEMLAGCTPFGGGPPLTVLRRQAEEPPPLMGGLPPRLWAYLESPLAKDPAARPWRWLRRPPTCCSRWSLNSPGCPWVPLMSAAPLGSTGSRISPGAHPDPFGPSGLDGWPSQGTVLRYRDRGGVPDETVRSATRSAPASAKPGQRRPSPVTGRSGHRCAHGQSSWPSPRPSRSWPSPQAW